MFLATCEDDVCHDCRSAPRALHGTRNNQRFFCSGSAGGSMPVRRAVAHQLRRRQWQGPGLWAVSGPSGSFRLFMCGVCVAWWSDVRLQMFHQQSRLWMFVYLWRHGNIDVNCCCYIVTWTFNPDLSRNPLRFFYFWKRAFASRLQLRVESSIIIIIWVHHLFLSDSSSRCRHVIVRNSAHKYVFTLKTHPSVSINTIAFSQAQVGSGVPQLLKHAVADYLQIQSCDSLKSQVLHEDMIQGFKDSRLGSF